MDTNDVLLYVVIAIVSIIVWAFILLEIIKSATRSKKIENLLTYQIRLKMIEMKKQGIPDEEINVAFYLNQKILNLKDNK